MTLWLVYRKDLARDTVVVRGIQEQVRQCTSCGWTDRTPDIGTRQDHQIASCRQLGGDWAGLLCLSVYVRTPAFITFAPLEHTDLAVTLFKSFLGFRPHRQLVAVWVDEMKAATSWK
jgi:hypothetical protein